MLAKRRNDADAWKEASTFLRGYKIFGCNINDNVRGASVKSNEEENNESVLPYLLDVLHKAESIPGGKRWKSREHFTI